MDKDCFKCLYFKSHRCANKKICLEGFEYTVYTGEKVRQCLLATVSIYQDGYIHCPVLGCYTCETCAEAYGDGDNWVRDESQNYDLEVFV